MRYPRCVICCCVSVVGLTWASAQESSRPQAPETPAPVKKAADPAPVPAGLLALQELVKSYTAAYNAGDAPALAASFTEDAEIIDDKGSVTQGRAAIQARFAATFADDPDVMIAIKPDSVRFLGDESAIEKGTATLTPGDGGTPEAFDYSVIYAKRGGKWLHALVRDEARPEPTHHERLSELSWMVGEWVNESDDAVVSTNCRWAGGGNFLVRDFDVKIEGKVALKGSQRIAWDPVHKQFRTWVFDDEGGFVEGFMARQGDHWLVKSTGVGSDGRPVSATTRITVLDKDRVGWEVVDRCVGGVAMPEIDQFITVRKAPEPGK